VEKRVSCSTPKVYTPITTPYRHTYIHRQVGVLPRRGGRPCPIPAGGLLSSPTVWPHDHRTARPLPPLRPQPRLCCEHRSGLLITLRDNILFSAEAGQVPGLNNVQFQVASPSGTQHGDVCRLRTGSKPDYTPMLSEYEYLSFLCR